MVGSTFLSRERPEPDLQNIRLLHEFVSDDFLYTRGCQTNCSFLMKHQCCVEFLQTAAILRAGSTLRLSVRTGDTTVSQTSCWLQVQVIYSRFSQNETLVFTTLEKRSHTSWLRGGPQKLIRCSWLQNLLPAACSFSKCLFYLLVKVTLQLPFFEFQDNNMTDEWDSELRGMPTSHASIFLSEQDKGAELLVEPRAEGLRRRGWHQAPVSGLKNEPKQTLGGARASR